MTSGFKSPEMRRDLSQVQGGQAVLFAECEVHIAE